MNKTCCNCKKLKPLDDFFWKIKDITKQSRCKDCHRIYNRNHYHKNKERYKKRIAKNNKDARLRRQKFIYNYLSKNPCIVCGEKDPVVLDFDHTDRKKKFASVSYMISKGYSISRVKEEINKCEIRCANCHRKKTAKELGWYKFLKGV